MKAGEYSLHVLIESTSSLSLQSDKDVDARIEIKAFGQTSYSKVKKDVGVEDTFWGEHFYFEKTYNNSIQISKQRITLSVFDHSTLTSDSLIGTYDIDVLQVYEGNQHKMEHFWCGLVNIQQDFSVITGYIKISVCVIGQGDKNHQLSPEPVASITAERKILLPPMIDRKYYQIKCDVIQAIDISPIDNGHVDPYIAIQFGQAFANTQPLVKNCNPKFHSRLYLPLSVPAAVSNIIMRILDYNFVRRGQTVGSHYINIQKLLKNTFKPSKTLKQSHIAQNQHFTASNLQWINFYGPQLNASKKDQKNIHQLFPQMATSYVGSALIRMSVAQNSDAENKCEPLQEKQVQQLLKKFKCSQPVFYRVNVIVSAALNLYKKSKKHKIGIQIGNIQISTDYAECENGFCVWNTMLSFTVKVFSNQPVPDVFIYLIDYKGRKVSYKRLAATDDPRNIILEDKWIQLQPQLSMVDYKLQEAGYLKIGVKMNRQNRLKASQIKKVSNKFSYLQKNQKKHHIYIELLSAHSLIPLDQDGSSDPFFTFSFMNTTVSSSLINDTLNPNYLQVLTLQTDIPNDQQACPPIIVNAYDKDKLSKQLIGTTFLDIGDLIKQKALVFGKKRPQPKQFALKQNNVICGYFIAAFYMNRQPKSTSIPPQIKFQCVKYKMIMVALGLRGMKPSSIFPVKRPTIYFDFESLSKFSEKNRILKSQTLDIQQSGNDIRIYKPLIQTIYLPQQVQYWPALSAVVKNNGIGKIYNSVLGYCSMNLRQAYKKSLNMKKLFDNRSEVFSKKKQTIKNKNQKLKVLSDNSILSLRNFILKASNYKWKVINDKMQLNRLNTPKVIQSSNLKKRQINNQYIVLFPCYQKVQTDLNTDKNEKNKKRQTKGSHYIQKYKQFILNNEQYMPIGYDSHDKRKKGLDQRNKHYRFVLSKTLQEYHKWAYGTQMNLMGQTQIRRGRKNFDSNDSLSSFIRKISTEDMKSGIFKADLVIIKDQNKGDQLQKKSQLFLKETKSLIQRVMKKQKVKMFLYIIDGRNLPTRDTWGQCDSFVVVKTGSKKYEFDDNVVKDNINPRYNQKVKIDIEFPKDSIIQIQVWDYDHLSSNQLIGSVQLDLEDRFQASIINQTWNNPIETHNIMFPTSKIAKGILRFWIDLVPLDMVPLYREFDIADKPPSNFEVRLIVWSVEGLQNRDFQGMNDLYVACQFADDVQETDVHYRSQNGEGYFNWRMIFPVKMPMKNDYLTLKIYDKDIFSGNQYLASCSFSIRQQLEEAFETDTSTRLFLGDKDLAITSDVKTGKSREINGKKMYDRFWIQTRNRDLKEEFQNSQKQNQSILKKEGKIQVSIEILTEADAKKRPAGKGRQDPNQNPYLPEPKNRMNFSLNPLKMIGQLCGQKFKTKICIGIIIILVITICLYLLTTFWGGFAGAKAGK